jgi:predicted Abi (CAAX) family protease
MSARVIAILAAVVIALAAAGCGAGSSSTAAGGATAGGATATTSTVHFAKTKFVLHAGLAFGAFHRYIYKPLKQGEFSGGLFHHKLATIKAALAAAFAYHEVKLALADARASKLLSSVLSPLLHLQTSLSSLVTSLRHGDVSPSAIGSANATAAQASQAGAKAGQPITDQPTPSF